jgi:hypothetical protein
MIISVRRRVEPTTAASRRGLALHPHHLGRRMPLTYRHRTDQSSHARTHAQPHGKHVCQQRTRARQEAAAAVAAAADAAAAAAAALAAWAAWAACKDGGARRGWEVGHRTEA